jgi:hypothetical protein
MTDAPAQPTAGPADQNLLILLNVTPMVGAGDDSGRPVCVRVKVGNFGGPTTCPGYVGSELPGTLCSDPATCSGFQTRCPFPLVPGLFQTA